MQQVDGPGIATLQQEQAKSTRALEADIQRAAKKKDIDASARTAKQDVEKGFKKIHEHMNAIDDVRSEYHSFTFAHKGHG